MLDGNIPAQRLDDFPVIDNRLHNYIIEKSDSFYIQDFFKRHAEFFKILFEWEGENREAAVDLQEMLDGNIPAQRLDDFPVIDNRLHNYIIEKSDSFYIQDFFKRHAEFFKILFEWEGENREAAADAVDQHRTILKALLNRDQQLAAAALSHHILHNHPILDNEHPLLKEGLV